MGEVLARLRFGPEHLVLEQVDGKRLSYLRRRG